MNDRPYWVEPEKESVWQSLVEIREFFGFTHNVSTAAFNILMDLLRSRTPQELKEMRFWEFLRLPNVGIKTGRVLWAYFHPEKDWGTLDRKKYLVEVMCPKCDAIMPFEITAKSIRVIRGKKHERRGDCDE